MPSFVESCTGFLEQKMTEERRKINEPYTYRTQMNRGVLSRSAKQRLKWMNHFDKYRNARLTCRHFGLSPDTFYLWKKRFSPGNLRTLEDDYANRKPHKLRVSEHKANQLETIRNLKVLNSSLGKTRIAKILKETGYEISFATVGRILKNIKDESLLR
jgi:transposase